MLPAMQRRLLLMRHAKSARDTDAPDDHSRPLRGRGRRDAARIARWLHDAGYLPDAVQSSDALRTRQTWLEMAPVLGAVPPVRWCSGLYHGGLEALREAAGDWDAAWATVLALGHNPGWEEALEALTGRAEALKTASCAVLLGVGPTWAEALAGPWQLDALVHPREL